MFTNKDFLEAERGEDELEFLSQAYLHQPNAKPLVTHEFDSVLYLGRAMRVAKRIRFFKGDVCKATIGFQRSRVVRLNRLGALLLSLCKEYRAVTTVGVGRSECPRFERHKFHPYLDVTLKAIESAEAAINGALSSRDQNALHQAIADLASEIYAQTNSESFKAALRNFERNAEAKLRRALNYLLSLFRKRSRLLVLRVDLYVREEGRLWSYTPEADAAFDKFAAALSSSTIVPDVLGWMSAREDGIERGRHYHVMAVLDGHEHRAGVSLAKMLGEYWVKECVGSGRVGSYFNCFALEEKYKHLGIGLIHYTDAKRLLGLFYATRYLCKNDVQLIATGDGSRNFRRGIVDNSYVRLGAPRARDDGLATAKQVLLGQMRQIRSRSKSRDDEVARKDAVDAHSVSPWR